MISLSTTPGGSPVSRWWIAVCSESIGIRRGAGGLGERGHELPADDQRLLVGERDVHALGERDDRRAEAGGADDAVEHEIGLRLGDQADEAFGAGEDLALRPHLGGVGRGVGIGQRDPGDAVLDRLLDERHVLA